MHMNKLLFTAMAAVILCACGNAPTPSGEIVSGTIWPDTQGVHINAHGGGVLQYKDAWYWFGEFKSERTSNALVGVTCYRSKDLTTWENLGVALKVSESGKIYGSVTTGQIEDALKAAGIEVDKKNITIPEDIKAVGEYEGTVKCYKAIKAAIKFIVEAEA